MTDRFYAVNYLKRQAYLLGEGEWGVESMHKLDSYRACYDLVKFATWTPERDAEWGDELDLILNAVANDLEALDVEAIVRETHSNAMGIFDFKLIGSRFRTRFDEMYIPPGITVKEWIEKQKP